MKALLLILFFILPFLEASAAPKADPDCKDIAEAILFRWMIVEKIDDHIYEIRSVDRGAGDPGIRAILKTHRGIFLRPGYPFGIKMKHLEGHLDLPLENGFQERYQVYDECGIVPLPKQNVMWEPGMSVRKRLKNEVENAK